MPFGGAFAVSGLRVFGHGDGAPAGTVEAAGERVDPRTASLRWDAADGAVGYNVRYGISPEKLYHSWLVYDRTDLEIGSLNAGHPYWFAVDSFNGAGVTPGAAIRID
ncbi:fibronectin type III domain-containing protein [Agromyces mangrovi Wang et al. 2018]|uniref:fibronectin type III domain-containing protein n=1 Tax=Agromyces mangrovi TaxID=1858653 RepID=UPI0025729077|nr:fibronectin type III domain-containing protein [Agromyces mangrovi]